MEDTCNNFLTYVFDKEKNEIWKIIDSSSSKDYITLNKVYPEESNSIKKNHFWLNNKPKCDFCIEPIDIDLNKDRNIDEIIKEFKEEFPEGFV